MKTSSLTYRPQHFIDLSPLAARYAVLTQAVLAFIAAGRFREVLRESRRLARLVRVYARLDSQNALWARKLEMLTDKGWRERVLRDLGGVRKLKLWERAAKRIEERALPRGEDAASSTTPPEPSWLYTPERIAESERLKARRRLCVRATAHPNITRDRVTVDIDGLFRLPPLPRLRARGRQVKVYTKNSIMDYEFNGMPFAEEVGIGAATVWPVEFYTAMELESDKPQPCHTDADVVCPVPMPDSFVKKQNSNQAEQQGMGSGLCLASQSQGRNDGAVQGTISLHIALDSKTYKDLFGDLSIGRELFDDSS